MIRWRAFYRGDKARRAVRVSWAWSREDTATGEWFDFCGGGDRCLEPGEWGVQLGPLAIDCRFVDR